MSETTTTIFFIAGATRGIASKYPSAIIYAGAGARDPTCSGSSALRKIAEKYPARVEVVKYVAADEEGNKTIAQDIQNRHGRVDIVIANAGILGAFAPLRELDINAYKEHFSVNTIGPIVLFKAFYHLLKASSNPKFVPITSVGGCLVLTPPMPAHSTCYSSTKAGLNWVVRKIHFENDWIVCFPLSPGTVETDLMDNIITEDTTGTLSYEEFRRNGAQSPEATANTVVDIIVASTRENEGGEFIHVDESRFPW